MENIGVRYGDWARKILTVFVILCAHHEVAYAGDLSYSLGIDATSHSNIQNIPTGGDYDIVQSAVAGINYIENSPELAALVSGSAVSRSYLFNTFHDDVAVNLNASAQWTMSPRRLVWTADESQQNVVRDPTQADTPANRVSTNAFNTGPDLFVHFGPVNSASLAIRRGNVSVENSTLDNSRYSAALRWLYVPSSVSELSLNLEHLRVNYYDDAVNADFQQKDYFFSYKRRQSRSLFAIDVGKTTILRNSLAALEGGLGRLRIDYQINSASTLEISVATETQDTGAALLSVVSTANSSAASVGSTAVISSDLFVHRQGSLSYRRAAFDFSWFIQTTWHYIDFKIVPDDREERALHAEAAYSPAATETTTIIVNYLGSKYTLRDRADRDYLLGLRYSYRIGRQVTVGMEVQRASRASSDNTSDFSDSSVRLTFTYSSGVIKL